MKILKALRLNAGLKQKDVAEALGLQTSTYTKYETEPRYPVVEMLKKLAAFYKFPIDYMIYHPESELSKEEIQLVANMRLSYTDSDPQIAAIAEKASGLNAQGLTRLEQYADDLLAAEVYRKKEPPLTMVARGGKVVTPEHPVDVEALDKALSELETTDNL